MSESAWDLVNSLTSAMWLALCLARFLWARGLSAGAGRVYFELRVFFWPMLVADQVSAAAVSDGASIGSVLLAALQVVAWWVVLRHDRDDDDDRWRRRGRRVLGRVRAAAGGLVVEPSG